MAPHLSYTDTVTSSTAINGYGTTFTFALKGPLVMLGLRRFAYRGDIKSPPTSNIWWLCFRFKDHPILNERYLLLSMLGKGGFSEVHKVRIT